MLYKVQWFDSYNMLSQTQQNHLMVYMTSYSKLTGINRVNRSPHGFNKSILCFSTSGFNPIWGNIEKTWIGGWEFKEHGKER